MRLLTYTQSSSSSGTVDAEDGAATAIAAAIVGEDGGAELFD